MKRFVFSFLVALLFVLVFSSHTISEAQFDGQAGAHVFVTNVKERDEVTGSTTSRILDFSWVVPWSAPRHFVALDEEGDFVAVTLIQASSTATSTQSGIISVAAPEFGAYTYVVRVCDIPMSTSSCVRSEPITIDIGERDIRLESEMKLGDFTPARASELQDLRSRVELAWMRALLLAHFHGAATSTIETLVGMKKSVLSSTQFYWRMSRFSQGHLSQVCALDTIETQFPLIDIFAKERCVSGATSTAYFPSDADIMDGLGRADLRTKRTQGLETYATGEPETSEPIIVGVYEDSDTQRRVTQPTQLPLSKLHIVQYGSMIAGDDGHLSFADPYAANKEYFAGQCEKMNCSRGILAEIPRMKKANPKLRTQMRVSISDSIFSSSTLRDILVVDMYKFLDANPSIDGFDLGPVSTTGVKALSQLASLLKRAKGGSPTLLSASVSCIDPECFGGLHDAVPFLDYVFIGPQSLGVSGAHHLAPLDMIPGEVKKLESFSIPTSKIVIDIPLRAKIWSDDAAYSLDLRTVRAKYMGKADFERVWDAKAAAATLVSSSTGLISYEDDDATADKALFVIRSKLAGIRFLDTMSDDGTLVTRASKVFGGEDAGLACTITMIPPRNLAENSRGRDVRALQDFLRCRDFIPGYIELNGSYGSITSAAVKLYQLSEGIEPLGTVGSSTRLSLVKYLAN